MKKNITAQQLFNLLTYDQSIIGEECTIKLTLKGITLQIVDKNIVGSILQDWLQEFLKINGYDFLVPPNSQEFPDFYLDPNDLKNNLLEIKAFDFGASPNFDVANFESYCNSLLEESYRLEADYLIFGYRITDSKIMIEKLWLKKIWEITGNSEAYPIRVQQKRQMIYNIRPIKWYSTGRQYHPFKGKAEFVQALFDTLMKYSKTLGYSNEWREQVSQDYLRHKGIELFP